MILFVCSLLFHGNALHVDRVFSPIELPGWLDNERTSGFAGKPSAPLTSVRAAENACSPDFFVGFNVEHSRCGFGSKVNNFMNQLAVAAYGNFSVSVAGAPELRGFLETWNSFFENPLPSCEYKKVSSDFQKILSQKERDFFQQLSTTHKRYAEDAKRAIYRTYYQYKADTMARIENTLKRYDLPDKFFGVQIRHGDKVEEADPIQTEDYAHIVQEGKSTAVSEAVAMARSVAQQIIDMESHNIRTVWLASIDREAEATLREILGGEYVIKSLVQTTKEWNGNADKLYYPGSEHVYDLLTDVEALRRSHTFIGTASSNIARLVYFLREPGHKAISLDESFLERAA